MSTSLSSKFFSEDFVWGVATSAFQLEGASGEDGRGPSIWDSFCKLPGVIADNSNGDIACDHYHRWESDLDLIAGLGVNAYRFSVSWSRVRPSGYGNWNEKGLSFYERLVDGLLKRDLQPFLTLNHWDLPDELQANGGWESRETVYRFVEYARKVSERLGDRVASITTHNEPWVMSILGHETGIFAPGIKDRRIAMQVSHNLLLSHGMALQALRSDGCKSKLGIVLNLSSVEPASETPGDLAKARLEDGKLLRWYMDPLFKGSYPDDVWTHLNNDVPQVEPGDMTVISTPMDYLGINYYSRSVASESGDWDATLSGLELTDMGWEIYPQGLTDLLVRLRDDYSVPPLYITENGGAFKDELKNSGVNDDRRTNYIKLHIEAVAEAMRQGVPMQGYMVWSLLDNFEWASGYEKRFGIVHVDYKTQKRTLKDSAIWYREFLKNRKVQRHSHELASTGA